MVGVHRKSIHELACVLTDLRKRVEGWMLFWSSAFAAYVALGATLLVFGEAAAANTTDPLRPPTKPHQTHNR